MNKVLNKIPWLISIILLTFVLILNFIYTSSITSIERSKIIINGLLNTAVPIAIVCVIFILCKILKNKINNINIKQILFGTLIVIYIISQLLWIGDRYIPIAADQKYAYQIATAMTEENLEEFVASKTDGIYGSDDVSMRTYIECYPHQLTLSFV